MTTIVMFIFSTLIIGLIQITSTQALSLSSIRYQQQQQIETPSPVPKHHHNIQKEATKAVTKPLPNHRILICPGVTYTQKDYDNFNNNPNSLTSCLMEKGGWKSNQIRVLPITKFHWIKAALYGMLDIRVWKGNAPPTGPLLRWYLDLIADEIEKFVAEDKHVKVILLGHSAGGWLVRAAVGFLCRNDDQKEGSSPSLLDEGKSAKTIDLKHIAGIVTLGAPHLPPPPGVFDITRGALRITNEHFPGAFFAPRIKYITVMSCSIHGQKHKISALLQYLSMTKLFHLLLKERPLEYWNNLAYESYRLVCGDGSESKGGDGFIPCCAAYLKGSEHIVLQNVHHTFESNGYNWYGSPDAIVQWHEKMLDCMMMQPQYVDAISRNISSIGFMRTRSNAK